MSDDMAALNTQIAALAAYERGDLEEALELHQALIQMDVPSDTKVSSHIAKSAFLAQLGRNEEAANEAESALELDAAEMTRQFEEEHHRAMAFPNLDCEWLDALKALGREGRVDFGIGFAEKKLRMLAHIPGNYMPLTQLWLGRKLAARGETARGLERLRSGMAAEVLNEGNYAPMVEHARSAAEKALQMYAEYGALSPQQAFEAGIAAEQQNDTERAIRAYCDTLELRVNDDVAAEAHQRLSILYAKKGDRDRAVQHGEEAMRSDLSRGGGFFWQPSLRDEFFFRLDRLWGQVAEEMAGREGSAAARKYLQERIELVRHVQGRYFALLRFLTAKYSVEMGDGAEVNDLLYYVHQSETHDSDIAGFDGFYEDVRERAALLGKEWSSQKTAGKCWIATAACGPNTVQVFTLCEFRDRHLTRGWQLRLVKLYYRTAPPVAKILERSSRLRAAVRHFIIQPLYRYANWRLRRVPQTPGEQNGYMSTLSR